MCLVALLARRGCKGTAPFIGRCLFEHCDRKRLGVAEHHVSAVLLMYLLGVLTVLEPFPVWVPRVYMVCCRLPQFRTSNSNFSVCVEEMLSETLSRSPLVLTISCPAPRPHSRDHVPARRNKRKALLFIYERHGVYSRLYELVAPAQRLSGSAGQEGECALPLPGSDVGEYLRHTCRPSTFCQLVVTISRLTDRGTKNFCPTPDASQVTVIHQWCVHPPTHPPPSARKIRVFSYFSRSIPLLLQP